MLSRTSNAASRALTRAAAGGSSSSAASTSSTSHVVARRAAVASQRLPSCSSYSTAASSTSSSAPAIPEHRTLNPHPTPESLRSWFAASLPTLPPLPHDVAQQVVTHDSFVFGATGVPGHRGMLGHSRKLSFVGRRALQLYTSLFLSTQRLPLSQVEGLINTLALGEKAGAALELHKVMRWTPARGDGTDKRDGLWKVRGTTVEALVGAVYHQFGAAVARDFFQAHILPTLAVAPSASAAVEAASSASLESLQRFVASSGASATSSTGSAAAQAPRAPLGLHAEQSALGDAAAPRAAKASNMAWSEAEAASRPSAST